MKNELFFKAVEGGFSAESCLNIVFLACLFYKGRGLTFAFARVLVPAPFDGPSFPPTDILVCTSLRSPCSQAPVLQPHVCHRQETGQSPLARTCSKMWTFLRRRNV